MHPSFKGLRAGHSPPVINLPVDVGANVCVHSCGSPVCARLSDVWLLE